MTKDGFSVNELLNDESCSGEHGKATIVDFLCAKDSELCWIRWLQSQGVESEITLLRMERRESKGDRNICPMG